MKKNIKIILGIVTLLIGLVVLFLVYKMYFSKNTLIEIYKKDNDYKVYLKEDTNKEIEGYSLYKTFGININDNEKVKNLELNLTNNKLNGIIINYEETVEDENAYSDVNNHAYITCSGNQCLLDYDSYYNLETNENMFKNLKIMFDIWNENYLFQTAMFAQSGIVHGDIYDINKKQKINLSLSDLDASNVFFIENNNKSYMYVVGDPFLSISRLYDNNNNLIIEAPTEKISLNYTCETNEYCPYKFWHEKKGSIEHLELDSYYYGSDGILTKYDLDGNNISNTKKYDEILCVSSEYSLVYQKSDNSVYIIKNDDTFVKKVAVKNKKYYEMNIDENGMIIIHGRNYSYGNHPFDEIMLTYSFNKTTGEIKIEN